MDRGSDATTTGASSGWVPGNPADDTSWNGFDVSAAIPNNSSEATLSFDYYFTLEFIGDVVNYKSVDTEIDTSNVIRYPTRYYPCRVQ